MMNTLVSILVPCYNAEKWLAETLTCALSQTWPNKEIIVVDDGSSDASLTVARQFESPVVKVISQENRGASAARNYALRQAQGDFLQYLDADDLLSPQKIEEQVRLLQQNRKGMLAVCGTTDFWDGQLPEQGQYNDGLPWLSDSDDPVHWLLRLWGLEGEAGMVHPAAWLTPRSIAEAAGPWDEQLSLDDDGEYFARIVLNSTGIRRSEPGVSYYRRYQTGKSLSSGNSKRHYASAFQATDLKAKQMLAREDSPRVRATLAKCYMNIAVLTYPTHSQVTDLALQKVADMGGTDYVPDLGPKIGIISKFFGWKTARLMSVPYHQWRAKRTARALVE
jgi:glycosyltransferase involved in cell wall biosynthesis